MYFKISIHHIYSLKIYNYFYFRNSLHIYVELDIFDNDLLRKHLCFKFSTKYFSLFCDKSPQASTVSFVLLNHLAATNIVAFKLDASFPLAGIPSRRVTDISRINIVENGKKCSGYGSRGDRILFLRDSRHRQSIPHVRTSPCI